MLLSYFYFIRSGLINQQELCRMIFLSFVLSFVRSFVLSFFLSLLTDYNNLLDEKQNPYIKRGFSMLARWRPFSNIGKQRTSIREANRIPFNDLDIVSAETRAMLRPVGQPLRWG